MASSLNRGPNTGCVLNQMEQVVGGLQDGQSVVRAEVQGSVEHGG